ncbi:MAG: cysteine dioxygenase family protein [Saprospiraceae bacterium]|nr:cysteine dioxygenase family protein [Saprospiraceae bacterium]
MSTETVKNINIPVDDIATILSDKIQQEPNESIEFLSDWFSCLELTDWQSIEKYEDVGYARINIHQSPDFDILLVCWKPGQYSPPHEHPSCGCLMKVVQGELFEDVIYKGKVVSSKILEPGEVRFICNEMGKHSVRNKSGSNAVSLHIYSPGKYKPA